MKNLVSTLALSACMVCSTAAVFAQSSSVGAGKENQQGTTMDGTGNSTAKADDATKQNMPKHKHKKMKSTDSSSGSMSSGSGSMGSAGAGSSAGSTPAPQ